MASLRALAPIIVLTWFGVADAAAPKSAIASWRLGFSGATVIVREDYRSTKWPVARRLFQLRGANGKTTAIRLHESSDDLSLYKAQGDRFLLLGAHDCVDFEPVLVKARVCPSRPPCVDSLRPELTHIGRFTWANGYDPPKGQFHYGWRFLPSEDTTQEAFCAGA